jgi:hypothetical protein
MAQPEPETEEKALAQVSRPALLITRAKLCLYRFLDYADTRDFVSAEKLTWHRPDDPVFLSLRLSRNDWQRKRYGRIIERREISAQYDTRYRSFPEGHYIIFLLELTMENRDEALREQVVCGLQDGKWRIISYAYYPVSDS